MVAIGLLILPSTAGDFFSSLIGNNSDGYIAGNDVDYDTAWTTSDTWNIVSNHLFVGQDMGSPDYIVYRSYLKFNTSDIPDFATVTDIKLSLNLSTDNSIDNFNISIYNFGWQEPLNGTAVRENNYDNSTGASFDATWINTIDITVAGIYYNSSSLNNSYINLTGNTKYMLRSDRDVRNEDPPAAETVRIYSGDAGPNAKPILYVTYSMICAPELNEDWVISDAQVCDGIERTTGTGSINITTGGTLTLINGANVSGNELYIETTGDVIFIDKSELWIN